MLTRSEPFREMARIFDDPAFRVWDAQDTRECRWCPAVDVSEDEKEMLVQVDLPGVSPQDVEISVKDGVLTLSGTRKSVRDDKERNYHRVERSYGSFSRSFVLPTAVDAEKVNAEYKDGVLRVHLPKREEVKPRRIEVKVS